MRLPDNEWNNFEGYQDLRNLTRRVFGPTNDKAVRAIYQKHIPQGERVVELGSGLGELYDLLNEERQGELLQTDRSAVFCSHNQRLHPEAKIEFADATDLPFPSGSLQYVFAINVFNMLSDPMAACAELGRVMARGGKFIHVLQMLPNHRYEITALQLEPDYITLPMMSFEQSRSGVYVMRKDVYKEAKKHLVLSPVAQLMLEHYEQEPLRAYDMLANHMNNCMREISRAVEKLPAQYPRKEKEFITCFAERMEAMLALAGLRIEEEGEYTVTSTVDRATPHKETHPVGDTFISTMGAMSAKYTGAAPPGMVTLTSTVRCLVARK